LKTGRFNVLQDLGTEHKVKGTIGKLEPRGVTLHGFDPRVINLWARQIQGRHSQSPVSQPAGNESATRTNVKHCLNFAGDKANQARYPLLLDRAAVSLRH
jgi:hypothetical protein